MQAQDESLVGFLADYLQPIVDILGIDWVTLLLVLDTLILLLLFVLIRVISGRSTVKVKLTVPKLPDEASLIPEEKFNGLKALFNSTRGALQILETLYAKKEIGAQMFEHLNLRYKVQLTKINEKFVEEMNAAERDRLQKTFDESIPTKAEEDAEPTPFPYLDLITKGHLPQELNSLQHAREIFPFHIQLQAEVKTGRQKQGLEAFPKEPIKITLGFNRCVAPDIDPKIKNVSDLPVNKIPTQPMLGDHILQHPPRLGKLLKHDDVVTLPCQLGRTCQSRGPSPDDPHLSAV